MRVTKESGRQRWMVIASAPVDEVRTKWHFHRRRSSFMCACFPASRRSGRRCGRRAGRCTRRRLDMCNLISHHRRLLLQNRSPMQEKWIRRYRPSKSHRRRPRRCRGRGALDCGVSRLQKIAGARFAAAVLALGACDGRKPLAQRNQTPEERTLIGSGRLTQLAVQVLHQLPHVLRRSINP